ncbi:ketosteroid isomerase-related protein [Shimia thalassica]|uniref:ketosteroid isomerase-related protein n=1 Tax=Shimia thalassica TaxID=1715693 RepID=UPI0026E32D79|nr:ketosteroid isomerase-related protein [Shimia thalassica]MDO6481550.1 ketosteroid isomerase-related protein [Shimia thalassica]
MSIQIIQQYYDAFNAGDIAGMVACLSDDFVHDVNEGARRDGKKAFAEFCAHMSECYKEELTDVVVFCNADGTRGAAEFIVNGTYFKTDGNLPEARGQSYRLPGGGFVSLNDGKITRVTTYYNLNDWIAQVS